MHYTSLPMRTIDSDFSCIRLPNKPLSKVAQHHYVREQSR